MRITILGGGPAGGHHGEDTVMRSPPFRRILVAVDDSAAALAAVRLAVDLASLSHARLLLAHVLGDGELDRDAFPALRGLDQLHGVRAAALRLDPGAGAASCNARNESRTMSRFSPMAEKVAGFGVAVFR